MMVKVTFVKIGFIATTNLVDALLDERASRKDLTMRVISSSVKMDEEDAIEVAKIATTISTDLFVLVSPNASLPGPKKAREILSGTGKPLIVISDDPSKKNLRENANENLGYIVVSADPMIGAKQSFLDPIEMALFNSDAIKVLAVTGSFRIIQTEIDKVINQIKKNEKLILPNIVIEKENALAASMITNPYAQGKIIAAFEAARRVANLSTEGTFKIEEPEKYLPILAAAHELMRQAAILADEAREIEKINDAAVRIAHFSKGETRKKIKLSDKYSA
ncbi:F420-dependent methylenetetrahydromethanopterin dehydrogenase [Candidatus Bathyarchaeota archaeon]|nr:F420-dependent methylenetetrahydromethanopterin dehydrogenase [Candidatus Bathyarchaeota archaeon]